MSYAVHRLPETPSPQLNSYLKSHFSESANMLQYFVGSVVCVFYEASSALYRALLRARGNVEPKAAWMAACGLLGVATAFAAWLAFSIVMAYSFIFHAVLMYASILISFAGLGLGAVGAFYFSNEVESAKHGDKAAGGSGSECLHRSSVTSSREYSRSHDD